MIRSIGLTLLAWALSACAPTVYMPNQLQTPMMREAGEFQATLGNSNLTAAVSVAPSVLLHAGGHYQTLNFRSFNGPRERAHQWLAEGGVGVFGDFGPKDLRWTVLAGGGSGETWARVIEGTADRSLDGRFVRGYVQPNIGWVTPYFEILASARFAGLKFLDFDATGYTSSYVPAGQDMTTPVWFFLESAVTVKVGYRWVKVFAQPVLSTPLNSGDVFSHLPLNVVVGVSLDLAQWHGDWSF